jgi:hypothetical protein
VEVGSVDDPMGDGRFCTRVQRPDWTIWSQLSARMHWLSEMERAGAVFSEQPEVYVQAKVGVKSGQQLSR